MAKRQLHEHEKRSAGVPEEIGYDNYLQVLLEEFKANREIYPQLEGQIATFLTVVVTLFTAALLFFPRDVTVSDGWGFLVLSMVFSVLGFGIGFRLRQFLKLSLYERLVLRPKTEALLQTQLEDKTVSVLEWQEFSERTLVPGCWLGQLLFGIQAAAVSLLPIGISVGLIVAFAIIKSASSTSWLLLEVALLIGSVVLLVLQALGYLFVLFCHQQEVRAP